MRKLSLIRGFSKRRKRIEPLPIEPRGARMMDLDPPTVREWKRVVSEKRARAAWKKLQELGQPATLPELLTYIWLESRHLTFDFQSSLMGGRLITGGAVADFIILDLLVQGAAIWRVQGTYWHSTRVAHARDAEQKYRLLNQRAYGMPIVLVVDLWEEDVYNKAPRVFRLAEGGIGIRD